MSRKRAYFLEFMIAFIQMQITFLLSKIYGAKLHLLQKFFSFRFLQKIQKFYGYDVYNGFAPYDASDRIHYYYFTSKHVFISVVMYVYLAPK